MAQVSHFSAALTAAPLFDRRLLPAQSQEPVCCGVLVPTPFVALFRQHIQGAMVGGPRRRGMWVGLGELTPRQDGCTYLSRDSVKRSDPTPDSALPQRTHQELLKWLTDSLSDASDAQPGRCPFVADLHLDYSSEMRWLRAARFCQGRNDSPETWGVSRIVELLRIKDAAAREQFIADHAPATMSVRELRQAVLRFLAQSGVPLSRPNRGLVAEKACLTAARIFAKGAALNLLLTGSPCNSDYILAPPAPQESLDGIDETERRVPAEIAAVRTIWTGQGDSRHRGAAALGMLEASGEAVPPLRARWLSPGAVVVTRGDVEVVVLPVRRIPKSRIVKQGGNTKTKNVFGIINSISQGCLREATGWEKSDKSCFDDQGRGGCFANHAAAAGFSIINNGWKNDLLRVQLPSSREASLRRYDRELWRVDAESADGSMSIALGLIQMWAESNHDKWFTTICSDFFYPSESMLCWLAALPNVWVGHTVSAWFSEEELNVRFGAIERFLAHGVPTTVWLTTDPDWGNRQVLQRALSLVGADQIIEYPHRHIHFQHQPVLHVNPRGACSDYRAEKDEMRKGSKEVVREGRRATYSDPEQGGSGRMVIQTEDRREVRPKGFVHARCKRCSLLCGYGACLPRHVAR